MAQIIFDTHYEIVGALTAPGERFEIAAASVRGHEVKVFANAATNVIELFEQAERQFADRDFLVENGRTYSWGETFADAWRLAGSLQDRYGVKPGDRVGLCMANRYEYFVGLYAIARLGAVAVLFNSRGAADELEAATSALDCSAILADRRRAALIRERNADTPLIIADAQPGEALPDNSIAVGDLTAAGLRQAETVRVGADDPCWVLFTSGTSGRPKGAVLTQRNICSMLMLIEMTMAIGIEKAARQYGMPADQLRAMAPPPASLMILPMFHISGLTLLGSALLGGGKVATLPRWNAAAAADLIEQLQVSALSGPPLVMLDLISHPEASTKLASLRALAIGGQATTADLSARCKTVLPGAGQSGGWGMTEASGSVCTFNGDMYDFRPDACGIMHPIMEFRAVDDDEQVLPPGVPGEIQLRGPLVMSGYWNQPEATEAAIQDGWYRTGDVGFLDEFGMVHIVDRKKDMVISSGENIYCAEVERVLEATGLFAEQILFGVPDERLGERAIAAVVPRPGVDVTEDQVKQIVRDALADYKVPGAVVFDLGPFPRNATGKVIKAPVRQAFLEKYGVNA